MRLAACILLTIAALTCFVAAVNWRSNADYPVWNREAIAYTAPAVPPEFQRTFSYPSKTPGMETETDDGPTVYLLHHQAGWNDCLFYFYQDWPFFDDEPAWSAIENEDGDAPWLVGAPLHINQARRDGWLQCARQIRTALRSTTTDDLRGRVVVSQLPSRAALGGLGVICTVLMCYVVVTGRAARREH